MSAELEVNRRNTESFIAANPVQIELVPRELRKDAYGQRWSELTSRPAQTFRLIDQSSAAGSISKTVVTDSGMQRKVEFILLGGHDSVVAEKDCFWTNGYRWEIAEVLPFNGYEVRAVVIRFGG